MVAAKRRTRRTLTLVVIAALTLAACGSDAEESGGDDRNVAKIGVIAPLSAAHGHRHRHPQLGRPRHQAGQRPEQDSGLEDRDRGRGRQRQARRRRRAATKLASDGAVVAVIGTYNSSVAQQTTPILDTAEHRPDLAGQHQRHPDPGQNFATTPARPYKNYFRTATLDSLQGGFAADYAYREPRTPRRWSSSTTGRPTARAWPSRSRPGSRRTAARSWATCEVIAEDVNDYSATSPRSSPSTPT